MIDFSQYSKEYIEQEMLGQVDEDIDTREGSMVQTAVAPGAWFLEGLYLMLSQVQDNSNYQTAVGKDLDLITQPRVTRKPATPAVREGTFDATIPNGSRFKTINGADSVVFVSSDLISHVGDVYKYKLTCESAGAIGNLYTGSILPITAITGLSSASIGTIITVGTDEETDAALRVRYEESFNVAAFGGNISAYRIEILKINGVGAVQVYPAYNGGSTVLCSILDSDYEPALQALVDTVQNIICPPINAPSTLGFGMAPIGAGTIITTATSLDIDVEVTITWAPGYGNGSDVQALEDAINTYIKSVAATWGAALISYSVTYNVIIYYSQVLAAIVGVEGVVNATSLTINSGTSDITCTETSALQEVPKMGTVTVHDN